MPFSERCEILQGFTGTADTTYVKDDDNTVCEALKRIRPKYFANGGDRKTDNTPEMMLCKELGIELLWSVGGGKVQSSSTLVNDAGMLGEISIDEDDPTLIPTRVEIVQGSEMIKKSNY